MWTPSRKGLQTLAKTDYFLLLYMKFHWHTAMPMCFGVIYGCFCVTALDEGL